jgi:hypothetical protein
LLELFSEKKAGVRSQNSGGVSNSPPELKSANFLGGESDAIAELVNSIFSIILLWIIQNLKSYD